MTSSPQYHNLPRQSTGPTEMSDGRHTILGLPEDRPGKRLVVAVVLVLATIPLALAWPLVGGWLAIAAAVWALWSLHRAGRGGVPAAP